MNAKKGYTDLQSKWAWPLLSKLAQIMSQILRLFTTAQTQEDKTILSLEAFTEQK